MESTSLGILWRVEKRQVADLKLWDKNPRTISKEAFEKLKNRIVQRGMHDVLKVDTDNTILSGNQRKQALVDLGVQEVWCLIPERDLTDQERDAVALESNKNDGQWDFDMLMSQFSDELLEHVGFTDEDLGKSPKNKSSITFTYEESVMQVVKSALSKFDGKNQSEKLLSMISSLRNE